MPHTQLNRWANSRMAFDRSSLRPADTENLGAWEHFLVVGPGEEP